jgi:hypothetical protein
MFFKFELVCRMYMAADLLLSLMETGAIPEHILPNTYKLLDPINKKLVDDDLRDMFRYIDKKAAKQPQPIAFIEIRVNATRIDLHHSNSIYRFTILLVNGLCHSVHCRLGVTGPDIFVGRFETLWKSYIENRSP